MPAEPGSPVTRVTWGSVDVHEADGADLPGMLLDVENADSTVQKTASGSLIRPFDREMSSVFSEEEVEFVVDRKDWGHQLVIHEDNFGRKMWNVILFTLLIYTGTVFPTRLCFFDFKIPESQKISVHWERLEYIVDGCFWFDLVINFFFTYTDEGGMEVDSLWRICKKYLRTYFSLNLIACLPEQAVAPFFGLLFGTGGGGDDSSVNKITRIARLQRTTRLARLARLVRLARLAKMLAFLGDRSAIWRWLQGLRGMRVVNMVVFLFWIVHIVACGWYLCAALHTDPYETWVARRSVDSTGTTLMERDSFEQWAHSMYFVFTIFTTVGFGDISATTIGEIVYVIFTMLIGAIAHSIIVSEVINIVTFIDTAQIELTRYKEILDGFVQHAHIPPKMKDTLKAWLEQQAHAGTLSSRFDKEAMREMVTSGLLPTNIMRDLPDAIYGGRLQSNLFLRCCLSHTAALPPRAAVLVSLCLIQRGYVAEEVVYQLHDHPFNIFLVDGQPGMMGTFAYVGKATPSGGIDEVPMQDKIGTIKLLAGSGLGSGTSPDKMSNTSSDKLCVPGTDALAKDASDNSTTHKGASMLHRFASASRLSSQAFGAVTRSSEALGSATLSQSQRHLRKEEALYPYQLFGDKNFFGDLELLNHGSRRCTARCEEKGWLLVLHKQDLWRLMEDFPHFAKAWLASAQCRETHRRDCLARLTHGLTHQIFAAYSIQKFYRLRLELVPPEKRGRKCRPVQPRFSRKKSGLGAQPGQAAQSKSGALLENAKMGGCAKQTEIDVTQAGGWGGDQRSQNNVASELRHELRTELHAMHQEMKVMMSEIRGEGMENMRAQNSRPDELGSQSQLVHALLGSQSQPVGRYRRCSTGAYWARGSAGAQSGPLGQFFGLSSANLEAGSTSDDSSPAAPSTAADGSGAGSAGDANRFQKLEAENRALRALVAEQQKHLDAMKGLILNGGAGAKPPQLPELQPLREAEQASTDGEPSLNNEPTISLTPINIG